MVTIELPHALAANYPSQIEHTKNSTIYEVIHDYAESYCPTLKQYLLDKNNPSKELASFMSFYINGKNINMLAGVDTIIKANDRIKIVPAIAGG